MAFQLPKPKDWQEFQRGCVVLFSEVFDDPCTLQYGRLGQRQDGIDILLYEGGDSHRAIAIQCRLITSEMNSEKILDDCRKALKSPFELKQIIFATSLPDSVSFPKRAKEIREALALHHEFVPRITIIGWDELENLIASHDRARAYYIRTAFGIDLSANDKLSKVLDFVLSNDKIGIPLEADLRRGAQRLHAFIDPVLIAAAEEKLRAGDLDGYTDALLKASDEARTERDKATEQQFALTEQIADAKAVQGKYDEAIAVMESGIALFSDRKDQPTEPFTGRWKIGLILAEKGQSLRDPLVLEQAAQTFDDLENDTYVKGLAFLRGRIITIRFEIKKLLLIMENRYDDIPTYVPLLKNAMNLAVQGFNNDVWEVRKRVWYEIFDAGDHSDNIGLLKRALDLATFMHDRRGYPIRRHRKERSRDNPVNLDHHIETTARLMLSLLAVYRVDQARYDRLSNRAVLLGEHLLAEISKPNVSVSLISIGNLAFLTNTFSLCSKFGRKPSMARAALDLCKAYSPEKDSAYYRGLRDLQLVKAKLRLRDWWNLSIFKNPNEIEELAASCRSADDDIDRFHWAEILEMTGDAYRDAALFDDIAWESKACASYLNAYMVVEPIFKTSPAYSSRLRARVFNKAMTLSPHTTLYNEPIEASLYRMASIGRK